MKLGLKNHSYDSHRPRQNGTNQFLTKNIRILKNQIKQANKLFNEEILAALSSYSTKNTPDITK
jgi:hypothetical protein